MTDPSAIYKAIGRNIRHGRQLRGWTQAELAERIGHSRSSVAIEKLCQYFGCELHELLTLVDD